MVETEAKRVEPGQNETRIVRSEGSGGDLVHYPVESLVRRVAAIKEAMGSVMKDGVHFGKIEGCGDKPALSKAGAEVLALLFMMGTEFRVTKTEYPNWHREYEVRCILRSTSTGEWLGEGVGCCSTLEKKYRYRNAKPACPDCGKDLFRSKVEYGGGWFCWGSKGGCGLNLDKDDDRIPTALGKVENPDPADQWNTILKMGKKRAFVDAVLTASAASGEFTQDVEEAVSHFSEAAITGDVDRNPNNPCEKPEDENRGNGDRKSADNPPNTNKPGELEEQIELEGELVEIARKLGMKGQRRETILATFQSRAKTQGMLYGPAFLRNEVDKGKTKLEQTGLVHLTKYANETLPKKTDELGIEFDSSSDDPEENPVLAFQKTETSFDLTKTIGIGGKPYVRMIKAFDGFFERWVEAEPGAFGGSVDPDPETPAKTAEKTPDAPDESNPPEDPDKGKFPLDPPEDDRDPGNEKTPDEANPKK